VHDVRILLTNDDGYRARGLTELRKSLTQLAELVTVAPDRNKSGASNSLTLDVPVRVGKVEPGVFFVTGTPTDCTHLAICGLFDFDFQMVCSGINDGPNLGDDVLYSGTVAAAMEGRLLGLPAIAFSLNCQSGSGRHFDSAARVARRLVEHMIAVSPGSNTMLNVNIPDLPYDQIRGIETTRLGARHRSERAIKAQDPRGRTVYWVGPAGPGDDAGPGTDFHAVASGLVSVTPLQIDLTRQSALDDTRHWLKAMPV
jgi:5'-nucleotidase